jgi:diacylglycerol kinase
LESLIAVIEDEVSIKMHLLKEILACLILKIYELQIISYYLLKLQIFLGLFILLNTHVTIAEYVKLFSTIFIDILEY